MKQRVSQDRERIEHNNLTLEGWSGDRLRASANDRPVDALARVSSPGSFNANPVVLAQELLDKTK